MEGTGIGGGREAGRERGAINIRENRTRTRREGREKGECDR